MFSFGGKLHPEILTDFPERERQTRDFWENDPFTSFKHQYQYL